MDLTISNFALLIGSLGVALAAIPTLIMQLRGLARDRGTTKLELVIDGERYVIDVDHLDNIDFSEIEAAVDRARDAQRKAEHLQRVRDLEAA